MGCKYFAEVAFRQVVFALCLFVALTTAHDGPHVTVEQGDLIGTTETFQESDFIGVNKTIDVFRGIPFAEPPVGPLRFAAPVLKRSWDGTYDATYLRDACVQDPSSGLSKSSEDCLQLNIYAPRSKVAGDAAVMVWFHGGGFTVSSAVRPDYNGLPLVAVGDVILVTVNYRLNIFGFLTTGDESAQGNMGLQDQVLALQWIQQNIAAFGGDNKRVTIFGESAGGVSVSLLILSQQAVGLFHNVIIQSGNAFSPWAYFGDKESLRAEAFRVGERLGCVASESATLVNCLREKNATALFTASQEAWFFTTPVIDGVLLEDTPTSLYPTGRYNHVKVLIGDNKDDGTVSVYSNSRFSEYTTAEEAPFISRQVFDQLVSRQLSYYFDASLNEQLAEAVRMQYIDWSQADNDTADYFRSYVDFATDFSSLCGADQLARFHAQGGDDVFIYHMTRVPSVSIYSSNGVGPGWMGASHAEELSFVFGYAFNPEVAATRDEFSDEDKALSVKFMEFWTNFAKTGNPGLKTPNSEPESDGDFWPRFTIPELEYKVLDLNLTTSRALKSDECHFLNFYVPQLESMLAKMDVVELEWKQAFSTWKNTDMAEWRDQFEQYKAGNSI